MSLFNRKNLENNKTSNKYGITEDDMIGQLKDFPVGVVVRMMEEQEKQGNRPNVKVFQNYRDAGKTRAGFKWSKTEKGESFWDTVIGYRGFGVFFKNYPEYEKYN